MKDIIVKNIGLSCYIDTLIASLFCINTIIRAKLLNSYQDSYRVIYLQEFIRTNIVDNINNNKSILEKIIINLKKLLISIGWYDNFHHIEKVKELYAFLMKKLDGQLIYIEEEYLNYDKLNNDKKLAYIDIDVSNINENKNIQELLQNWIYNQQNRDIVKHIVNIPTFIGININRLYNGTVNNVMIDINKGISPATYSVLDNKPVWGIHSIICYEGDINKGHYYSLLNNNNEYFIYDNSNIPTIINVNIKNVDISKKIKQECIFLIYRYIGYK